MAEKSGRTVVKRHQFADYLNVATEDAAKYVLMGTGFTTLDEKPGAQTETKKYVNEAASSKSVVGYETVFPFESDFIKDQEAIIALYNVGRNHYLGSDAEFEYVRVELWNPTETENEFEARKFVVSAEISEISGENDMQVSGNLNAMGDPVNGKFNTETKTFTPAELKKKLSSKVEVPQGIKSLEGFDKTVGDLIADGATVDEDGNVTATLHMVQKFEKFSSNAAEQSGHYFPFSFDESVSGDSIEVKKNGSTTKTIDFDPDWILRVERTSDRFEFIVDSKPVITLRFTGSTLE